MRPPQTCCFFLVLVPRQCTLGYCTRCAAPVIFSGLKFCERGLSFGDRIGLRSCRLEHRLAENFAVLQFATYHHTGSEHGPGD